MMSHHQLLVRRHQEATHPTWTEDWGREDLRRGRWSWTEKAHLALPTESSCGRCQKPWKKLLQLVILRETQRLPQPPKGPPSLTLTFVEKELHNTALHLVSFTHYYHLGVVFLSPQNKEKRPIFSGEYLLFTLRIRGMKVLNTLGSLEINPSRT